MARKAYVRIQSQQTIQVTCGLQNVDVTNPDAHVPDRLKISPSWPRCSVVISEGAHVYPSEIVEWSTVKALEKDGILTIGQFLDSADETVVAKKEALVQEMQEKGITSKSEEKQEKKASSLADIAGEE